MTGVGALKSHVPAASVGVGRCADAVPATDGEPLWRAKLGRRRHTPCSAHVRQRSLLLAFYSSSSLSFLLPLVHETQCVVHYEAHGSRCLNEDRYNQMKEQRNDWEETHVVCPRRLPHRYFRLSWSPPRSLHCAVSWHSTREVHPASRDYYSTLAEYGTAWPVWRQPLLISSPLLAKSDAPREKSLMSGVMLWRWHLLAHLPVLVDGW